MEKRELRRIVNAKTLCNKEEKEKIIASLFLELAEYQACRSVFLFLAAEREPDTLPIIADALLHNKRVFVPVTKDIITLAEIDKDTQFVCGKYGIMEPKQPKLATEIPDLIIVPMVACDNSMGRLGHGMGYYDKYLSKLGAIKIGITFSDFIVESVLSEPHDIKMDKIITDKGII